MGKRRKGGVTPPEPGSTTPPTRDDARLMDVQQGGRCFLCDEPLGAHTATYDHVVPRAGGGADVTGNVVLVHGRCNRLKGDRLPWPDEIERLIELRRGSRLGVWPPLLTILTAETEEEVWRVLGMG